MAARFWRGTTSTDWSNTNNWSATSGGATGASVPSASDDVTLDGSGNNDCTLTASAYCKNFTNTSGYTKIFDQGYTLTISGSMSLNSSIQWKGNSINGGIVFNSTTTGNTVGTGGETIHHVTFNGVGGEWTLTSALTIASFGGVTVTNGTFISNGYAITAPFIVAGSGTKSITLGNSTLTLSGTRADYNSVDFVTNVTGLTLSCASADFVLTGVDGAAYFGNVTIDNLTATSLTGLYIIDVATVSTSFWVGPSAYGNRFAEILLARNTTVGTFLTANTVTSNNTRLMVKSTVRGAQRTLSIGTFGTFGTPCANIDWQDIAATGAAAPITGTDHGNAGNISGITTRTPVTRYATAVGNWSSVNTWSDTSGGAGPASSVPICHDDIVFNSATTETGTYTIDVPRIGHLTGNCGAFTIPTISYAGAADVTFFGNLFINYRCNLSFTGTGSLVFQPLTASTISLADETFGSMNVVFEAHSSYGGSITIAKDLVDGYGSGMDTTGVVYHKNGTLTFASITRILAARFESNSGYTRSIVIGSGSSFYLTSTGNVFYLDSTGLTYTGGSETILIVDATTTTKTILVGNQVIGSVALYGAAICTYYFAGSGTIADITNSKGVAFTLQFAWFFTAWTLGTLTAAGTAGNLITWKSDSAGNQVAFYTPTGTTPIVLQYYNIQDVLMGHNGYVVFTPNPYSVNCVHAWNSTDSGNNTNIKFMPRDVYKNALPLLGAGT